MFTLQKYRNVFEENGEYYYLNDAITTRGEGGTLNARPNLGYTVYFNPTTIDIIGVADYDLKLAKTSNVENEVYHTDTELLKRGYIPIRPPRVRGQLGCWTWELAKFNSEKHNIIITGKQNSYSVRKRTFVDKKDVVEINGKLQFVSINSANSRSILDFSTNEGTNTLNDVMVNKGVFSNPKNLEMLKYLLSLALDKNFLVLDFFSGSATTAHAVMQLNAEDGGHRKFIMVQLPEETDPKSEAYKAGYKNICEIGKERIRRAGAKINSQFAMRNAQLGEEQTLFDSPESIQNGNQSDESGNTQNNCELRIAHCELDIGFRVLKLDSTNMTDVYYTPAETSQQMLLNMESNIKEDRTDLDLLFGCLLDWGLPLSLPYTSEQIDGVTVHTYNDGDLIACFDKDISEDVIKTIAKREPLRVVFRDDSFADSPAKINVEEIFKMLSPDTRVKVI